MPQIYSYQKYYHNKKKYIIIKNKAEEIKIYNKLKIVLKNIGKKLPNIICCYLLFLCFSDKLSISNKYFSSLYYL